MTTVLMLGDIVSSMGVAALRRRLKGLIEEHNIDFVIANGENATGGIGLDKKTAKEILDCGVDCITLGDHTWSKKDLIQTLDEKPHKVIRPINFPKGAPGAGSAIFELSSGKTIGVANAIGRVFFNQALDCPFKAIDELYEGEFKNCDLKLLDFHAEATSEKIAMGYHVDGRFSLVVGTHTHVQTADDRVLPKGTGFLTDLGMCGPDDGVIGMDSDQALGRFIQGLPFSYKPAKGIPVISGIVCKFKGCLELIRIREMVKV